MRPAYVSGAILGGFAMGILNGLPIIQCCCCLWAPAGGLLAALIASRPAITFGWIEGTIAAVAASIIAVPVNAAITIPMHMLLAMAQEGQPPMENPFLNDPSLTPQMKEFLEEVSKPGTVPAMSMAVLCYGALPAILTGWIGGFAGGFLFKKEDFGEEQADQVAEVFE